MKAPFPYFGGKSEIADVIWSRLGDTSSYVEGFFIIHGTFAAPDAASFQYRTGQSASFMTYSVINPSTGVPTIVLIDQS